MLLRCDVRSFLGRDANDGLVDNVCTVVRTLEQRLSQNEIDKRLYGSGLGEDGVIVMARIFRLCGSDALREASVRGALVSAGKLALNFALLDLISDICDEIKF